MANWVGGNRYLNTEEMTLNANYIYNYLGSQGWTINAISGMLGNMQTESTINPSIWQSLDEGNLNCGYGLVQWTPASNYINWCESQGLTYSDMDSNLKRIIYEEQNGEQWIKTSAYPITFTQFKSSKQDPYTLAMAFIRNYERPANPNQPNRGTQAQYWYQVLSGLPAPSPIPPAPGAIRNNMPIWMYLKRRD